MAKNVWFSMTHPVEHKFAVNMLDGVESETTCLSGLGVHELSKLRASESQNLLPRSIYPNAKGPLEPRGVDGQSASKVVKFKQKLLSHKHTSMPRRKS